MTARLRRVGEEARKVAEDLPSGAPEIVLRRAGILRAAGVPTVLGRYDAARRELVFPWIDGVTGKDCFHRERRRRTGAGPGDPPLAVWQRLLEPLARLHDAAPESLALQPLDPWRKIKPRLAALKTRRGLDGSFLRQVESSVELCARALRILAPGGASHDRVVHGDFHLGQILVEDAWQRVWLLDLDDLALGPPESDLGNFAAHLATSPRLSGADSLLGFDAYLARVRTAYESVSARSADARRLWAYGAVALLRRALKGWEGGQDLEGVAAILRRADASATAADSAAP